MGIIYKWMFNTYPNFTQVVNELAFWWRGYSLLCAHQNDFAYVLLKKNKSCVMILWWWKETLQPLTGKGVYTIIIQIPREYNYTAEKVIISV